MANQHIVKISATELARNLASIIDKVRIERTRMTITKGNQDVAQIMPIIGSNVTLTDLAFLLGNNKLSSKQKQGFSDDLTDIRQRATLPESSWD